MSDDNRVGDVDLYMATIGSRCISCDKSEGKARLFMPPHPIHLGNVVVLCDDCETRFRPMSIDVFAHVAMAKYDREEEVFGFRLPTEIDREFELRLARRGAERLYAATHPQEIKLQEAEAQ